MPPIAKSLAWICALIVAFAFVAREGFRLARLSWWSNSATGYIIETHKEEVEYNDGRSIGFVTVGSYQFNVKGETFDGRLTAQADRIEVGDQIAVIYDPADPSINNCSGDRNDWASFFVLLVFASIIGVPVLLSECPIVWNRIKSRHATGEMVPTFRAAILSVKRGFMQISQSPTLKNNAGAVIIAGSMIVCMLIYACATRYVHVRNGRILDKWTGTTK
jgi:hypothetical protein